jgi:hypothetical protein
MTLAGLTRYRVLQTTALGGSGMPGSLVRRPVAAAGPARRAA